MSDAAWFGVVFVAFFLLRAMVATCVFLYLLPAGDACPNCGESTLRIESPRWNRMLPWFRTSWCYSCGWEGLLRNESESGAGNRPALGERTSGLTR
jgi:hypothetical protein